MTHTKAKSAGLALALLTGLSMAAIGQASDAELQAGKRWLALMNRPGDSDKTISKTEFDRYMNEQFDQADADHDGTLNPTELGHLRKMLLAK